MILVEVGELTIYIGN